MAKKSKRPGVDDEKFIKRMKKWNTEEAERRKRAESNPLIWFPARMLAAGGNLTIPESHDLIPAERWYNILYKDPKNRILKIRDLIDEAYWFYLDVLEDPWQAAYDELLSTNEDDLFLNWPDGMNLFSSEYLKWERQQVLNRTPKPTDSKRLRVATFLMGLLKDEDFNRPPDEIYTWSRWYTLYHSLHEHWRSTISMLLDFAINKPDAKYDEILKRLKKLDAIEIDAAIAAARNKKELDAKCAGGRKGAAIAKAERGEDRERKAILDEAKDLLDEWDKRYPDRHKPPQDKQHSDNAAFRIVANRHTSADGKPIIPADTIGRTLRRLKANGEKRGKYNRTGKKRGKYKTRT